MRGRFKSGILWQAPCSGLSTFPDDCPPTGSEEDGRADSKYETMKEMREQHSNAERPNNICGNLMSSDRRGAVCKCEGSRLEIHRWRNEWPTESSRCSFDNLGREIHVSRLHLFK